MDKSPIIEIYKGVPIRYSNVVRFRASANELKRMIDIAEATTLCIPDIVKASSQPCQRCVGVDVIVLNSHDEEVRVPRGIFKESKQKRSGVNILNQNEINKRRQ